MENAKIHTPRDLANAGEPTYTPATDRPVLGHHGDPNAEYAALKETAAVVDLPHKTVLRLTGKDPLGMLCAVLTNKVPERESLGAYALLLNNKGRVQADLRVLKDTAGVLVVTEPEGAEAAKELLGRYAPFSRVKLEDLSESEAPWSVLGLYGPRAGSLLGELELAEHETMAVDLGGSLDATLLVAGVAVPVPGFDLFGPADAIDAARALLVERGAVPVGLYAYETARVGAGVPRYGSDMTTENFPAEAGLLDRAVSFEKGCYPGQETVARMRYRGHPNKTLHRLAIEGPAPEAGTPIFQGEKKVGTVTSVAHLPVDGRTLALGYLSRNADLDGPLHAGKASVSLAGDSG
jgi:aminomethyltransferase